MAVIEYIIIIIIGLFLGLILAFIINNLIKYFSGLIKEKTLAKRILKQEEKTINISGKSYKVRTDKELINALKSELPTGNKKAELGKKPVISPSRDPQPKNFNLNEELTK